LGDWSRFTSARGGKQAALAVLALVGVAWASRAGVLALTGAGPDTAPLEPARPTPAPAFASTLDVDRFHKGNLHTHSLESDGDAEPAAVYRWYREHGYQFVAITDHNHRIDPRAYRHLERPGFKILAGEEITTTGQDVPVHVNAICTTRRIGGGTFPTKALALAHAIDSTALQGAVSIINHPNFATALDAEDLWQGRDALLLEIWSGHPYVYSDGVDGRPSHEALWSALLDRGASFFGVAVDDTHHIATHPSPGKAARPGRGWVATFAESSSEVTEQDVCESLRTGRFYASNGAVIERLSVSDQTIRIWTADPDARIEFVGQAGRVLDAVPSRADGASYTLRGEERWVRARVLEADGDRAWTQVFRVTR